MGKDMMEYIVCYMGSLDTCTIPRINLHISKTRIDYGSGDAREGGLGQEPDSLNLGHIDGVPELDLLSTLVGLRRHYSSSHMHWIRIMVTDENPDGLAS